MCTKLRIRFRGFDERGEVRIYHHGILPHWRQAGCTYFVTFRQDDSLPAPMLREIEYERHLWLGRRGIDPNERNWKNLLRDFQAKINAPTNASSAQRSTSD
jgi:hypothetical protein